MPQIELLEGHRILLREVRNAQRLGALSRSLRPYLRTLYSAGYVSIAFDWEAFDTLISLTDDGSQRLDMDRASNQTRL